jgi:acyl-coenzyme A synthetase/AMP-(fatty) acid ligase
MSNWGESLRTRGGRLCFVGGPLDERVTYCEMADRIGTISQMLTQAGVTAGSVVAFPGQYSADNVATFLAIADLKAVAVPMPDDADSRIERLMGIARVTHAVDKSLSEKGSDPLRRGRKTNEIDSPPKGQTPFRIGTKERNVAEVAETFGSGLSKTHETLGEFRYGGAAPDETLGEFRYGDSHPARHPLYERLVTENHAGLVLFTSGTTGDPKAAVQDLDRLRLRYSQSREVGMMLAFMHIDHIGGINTLLYVLSHGGTLVVPKSRSPHDVAAAIAEHRIQVLPVSPTFLNLLLISGAADRFDLSSLRRITYGSEPMPQSVLDRVAEMLPGVELLQTYGTTELGILKSKSENNGSLWMKVGGDGYETKIAEGRLWVRAQTAMLGYLNADSPFDDEGFMDTGDEVEVRGDWLRVLGRKSDFINVGGTKVSPVEVESVLLEMPCVAEVAVVGRPHPMMGQVVEARVRLCGDTSIADFKAQMREHCRGRLPVEAIPVKVSLTKDPMVTDRFKRERR